MPGREPATPSLVRAINLRTTFDLVYGRGPLGAPGVVRETGLSRPTVAECMAQLLELDLIRRAGRAHGLPGPGAQLYEVNPRAGWVLGLDIGREWVRAGLTDLSGGTYARTNSRTQAATAGTVIAQLSQVAARLLDEAEIGSGDLDQVVVGTPGVIRPGDSHFSLAPNIPGWESLRVVGDIRDALMAPVVFENDVNLAAIGEHVQGVARGVQDFALVSIGTGVGMGVVLDGELRHGSGGLAGEIGYLALDLDSHDGQVPPSWGEGAFEQLVSAGAIMDMVRGRGLDEVRTTADLFARARSGDEAAKVVVEVVARRLAHGIAAISAVVDPELVVLGGGVGSGGGDLLLDPVARALRGISPFAPRLAVSSLGANAVLAGAAALGLHLALDRIFERAAAGGRMTDAVPSAARGAGAGSGRQRIRAADRSARAGSRRVGAAS